MAMAMATSRYGVGICRPRPEGRPRDRPRRGHEIGLLPSAPRHRRGRPVFARRSHSRVDGPSSSCSSLLRDAPSCFDGLSLFVSSVFPCFWFHHSSIRCIHHVPVPCPSPSVHCVYIIVRHGCRTFDNFAITVSQHFAIMCPSCVQIHSIISTPLVHHVPSRIRHVSFSVLYLSIIRPACFRHSSMIASIMFPEIAHHDSIVFPSFL